MRATRHDGSSRHRNPRSGNVYAPCRQVTDS